MTEVVEAAKLRAARMGQPMSAVARTVLWEAARNAGNAPPEDIELPSNYLTGRGNLKRVRFTAPALDYGAAVARIEASGSFPSYALEDGLESYARTGDLYPNDEIREKNRLRRLEHDPQARKRAARRAARKSNGKATTDHATPTTQDDDAAGEREHAR